ncbi:hypothetical protein C436_20698 [Haloarcula marismortui ATCC 33800]|uniref:Uncharacterized protein n=1 Tax=Haloarcula marismortui ATCC 33800 TaxID=662476 RepID=M0JGP3_9EURY|nr:hypothetical protein C436_20698 [Haloarcula sinaiiensis ATCC 33800]
MWLQSHKGSSETRRSKSKPELPARFNPTRVRLKRDDVSIRIEGLDELQSHKGSSETMLHSLLPPPMLLQSHKGSSETVPTAGGGDALE